MSRASLDFLDYVNGLDSSWVLVLGLELGRGWEGGGWEFGRGRLGGRCFVCEKRERMEVECDFDLISQKLIKPGACVIDEFARYKPSKCLF